MVIVNLSGGFGNQFWQYATGKCIAHKLNTELKLNLSKLRVVTDSEPEKHDYYRLGDFNIQENIATPEEVTHVTGNGIIPPPIPDLRNCKQDILIQGSWMMPHEAYYAEIIDIIRKEFTLKKPLSPTAKAWKQKILAEECAVSLHVRHGDYAYNPNLKRQFWAAILPLDYYYTCVDILKSRYDRLKLFVFSNNINWCKENLRLGVPTEFVSGGGDISDIEEFHLMNVCKHNIIAHSTFSYSAASMNANPHKKILRPYATNAETVQRFNAWLQGNKNQFLDSGTWISVPFDFYNQPNITMRPRFSLLLVVNDDAAILKETLGSILGQDYKFYELIIVDNCSTDGSGKLCRQAAQGRDNVTLIKLWNKIPKGAAWNKALDLAQGDFVLFLKGNDRLLSNALSQMYLTNEYYLADVVASTVWLRQNDGGNIDLAGRKFAMEQDAALQNLKGIFHAKFDKATLLRIFAANGDNAPIATKIFKRKFLADKGIRFNDTDDAELLFTMDAMFQSNENIFVPNVFYIAPRK